MPAVLCACVSTRARSAGGGRETTPGCVHGVVDQLPVITVPDGEDEALRLESKEWNSSAIGSHAAPELVINDRKPLKESDDCGLTECQRCYIHIPFES